jgi:hypothetical protein
MGTKRFGLLGATGFLLLGAWVMGVEKDNPGTTAANAGAVKDVSVQVVAEGAAVVPEVQAAIAPAMQSVSGFVSGATGAASGTADPALGGSSAADGGGTASP